MVNVLCGPTAAIVCDAAAATADTPAGLLVRVHPLPGQTFTTSQLCNLGARPYSVALLARQH